jgi:hypothetical protein
MQPANSSHSAHGAQRLNPLDAAICYAERSVREMGYPGFETQMLLWLSGRLNVARLRQSLLHLTQRRPVVTARLSGSKESSENQPCWCLQEAPVELIEFTLTSAEPDAVIQYAAESISKNHDLAVNAPLRFHLVHRSNGQDVFLMQYSHVLMDKSASVLVLREINELYWQQKEQPIAMVVEPPNLLHRYLMRLPIAQRRAASRGAVELHKSVMRGRAAILGTGAEAKPGRATLCVATRMLERQSARALYDRSANVCGLPNLSMVVLASAFRTIERLGSAERNATRNYVAAIGLDMKQRQEDRELLQNLISVVPIFAQPGKLADRDRLVRNLSQQMRDRLRDRVDWGMLRLVNTFHRNPRYIRWVAEHLARWTYSLWYAYFGSLDAIGDRFCGLSIESAYYIGPTWSPMGLSLLANQFQGRMHFQVTYDPELVGSNGGEAFLDALLEDLGGFADG